MPQPTIHILNHVAAIKPRVGEVEVAFREHFFVSWNEDHLGIKIGTDGGVIVEVGSGRAGNNQNAVAGVVVFGHAQMELGGNGICSHVP